MDHRPGKAARPSQPPRGSEDRAITGRGAYNLNFIDWDNEFEAVLDHVHKLNGKAK
jgi:hypothetical protein